MLLGVGLIPLTTNHNYLQVKTSAGLLFINFIVELESDLRLLVASIYRPFGVDDFISTASIIMVWDTGLPL